MANRRILSQHGKYVIFKQEVPPYKTGMENIENRRIIIEPVFDDIQWLDWCGLLHIVFEDQTALWHLSEFEKYAATL